MIGHLLKCSGVALLLVSIAGCGTIYVHSDVRQKQGEDATKAWSEVDLKSTFRAERENLAKLVDAELETQDRLALTVRDAELRKLIAGNQKLSLRGAISGRLEKLGGNGAGERFTIWKNARTKLDGNAREQAELRERAALLWAPTLSCDDLLGPAGMSAEWQTWAAENPDEAALGQTVLNPLRKACKAAPELNTRLEKSIAALGGSMRVAVNEFETVRAEIAAAKATRASTATAVKAYEAAVENASEAADPEKAAKKVKDAAAKLAVALKAAARAEDAFSKELVSKERIKALEKTLIDIASNAEGKPPKNASDAIVAGALLPQIADDAREIVRAGRVPETLPLVIRLNIERLRLEAATREVKSLEAQLDLSEAIVDELALQGFQLEEALRHLDHSPARDLAALSLPNAFAAIEKAPGKGLNVANPKPDPAAADKREALYRAAAQYLDAIGRLDARYYRLEYMRIAAIHEQSLSRSEVYAAQWESLIDSTVKQAAQHTAGGIKASDLTGLISALGIVWIGHGTNQ
jgi:hypothetical protein